MKDLSVTTYRKIVNDDSATLGSFLSPHAHGLKLFVYLQNEKVERLRAELNAAGTEADESGSDLSRGFYASYTPEA